MSWKKIAVLIIILALAVYNKDAVLGMFGFVAHQGESVVTQQKLDVNLAETTSSTASTNLTVPFWILIALIVIAYLKGREPKR
jgi:hypothetical protein